MTQRTKAPNPKQVAASKRVWARRYAKMEIENTIFCLCQGLISIHEGNWFEAINHLKGAERDY